MFCNSCNWKSLYNRDGPFGIQCLCSLSADLPKWGLFGTIQQLLGTIQQTGLLNKKASGAQCFIMALGLF